MNFTGSIPLKSAGLRIYCVHFCKKTFVFTGGEIVNEFLMSTGYLPGAHSEDCPVFDKVAAHKPAWMSRTG